MPPEEEDEEPTEEDVSTVNGMLGFDMDEIFEDEEEQETKEFDPEDNISSEKKLIQEYHIKSLENAKHKYGCLMLSLPADLTEELREWGNTNIHDDELEEEGRENNPHITVLYGFVNDDEDTVSKIRNHLARMKPIEIVLGGLSLFEGNKEGDVLKVDVKSPYLHKVNRFLTARFPIENKHPEYIPHLTIAYLNPQVAKECSQREFPLEGLSIILDTAIWSGRDGQEEQIPIGGGLR